MYSYEYLSTQKTNQDLTFTQPVLTKAKLKPKTDSTSGNVSSASSKSGKKVASSKTTRTIQDNAAKIEGTYVGNGTLKQGSEVVERYSKISVTIKRQSKDAVLVNVIEPDGTEWFVNDCDYTINKVSKGKYYLTLDGISTATIEIDKQNNLVYLHPRVDIEGDIYTLSITASKSNSR